MMRRLALIIVLFSTPLWGLSAAGCGASGEGDGGPGEASTGDIRQDIAAADLVVINGLDQALSTLGDTDVRVCLGVSSTDYPLPNDPSHPIPLSNYPGIPLGGGVDLGARALPATLYVISALAQNENYPGGTNVTACDKIISDAGAASKPYLAVSVTPQPSSKANLVVLLDGPTGAVSASASIDDQTYGPNDAALTVNAQVGAFGPWARQTVLTELVEPSDASTTLALFDGGAMAPGPSMPIALPSFADRSLRFTSPSSVPGSFTQSFQSIQTVSDPTTSPDVFYGVRSNFLFVLLGTPQPDAAAPGFGDRGLHVVAIPYVP